MARVSTYLNFPGTTEEAFTFYKSVFGTEFEGEMARMKDVPPQEGVPPLTEEEGSLVMHVALPILGGHMLMGTDSLESMGQKVVVGNNVHINLEPDTREELDRLFAALSEAGTVEMEPQIMFWGDYFAACTDRFGISWMFNCAA